MDLKQKILSGMAVLLLAACTARPASPTPLPPPVLRPYATAAASLTPTLPIQTAGTPLPTSTPFMYTVQSGDTLSGIAEKFQIRLEVLQAANPGISPNSMAVGAALKIPADSGNPAAGQTPTPVSLPIRQVACYPASDGSLGCFVLVHNDSSDPVENLSAQVTLYDPEGQVLASQEALSPLNILPPDASQPLMAFFPPGLPAEARPRLQLLSATRLLAGDERYLPAVLQNSLVQVSWSGQTAQVSGRVFLPETAQKPAGLVWVAAAAYAADGRVVGVRRWESTAGVAPGAALEFAFLVASLGPPIERVELFVEARPE